jgi:hypothetical protein
LAHVVDVEQADGPTGQPVFLEGAEGILDRHVVPGEGREPGSSGGVQIVKRGGSHR